LWIGHAGFTEQRPGTWNASIRGTGWPLRRLRAFALVEEHAIADPGDALTKLDDYIKTTLLAARTWPSRKAVVRRLVDTAYWQVHQ
jgi:hypothetical protein